MMVSLVMEFRYYLDPETGLPHIYHHGVTEAEAEWILAHPGEDDACSGGSRQALADGGGPLSARGLCARRRRGWHLCGDGLSARRQTTQGVPAAAKETRTMNQKRFPKGWDEQRVKKVDCRIGRENRRGMDRGRRGGCHG